MKLERCGKILLGGMIILGVFFAFNSNGLADGNSDTNARVAEVTQMFKQRLSLSDEQTAKVQQIFLNAMANQMPSNAQTREQFEAEQKQKKQQIDSQIAALLTSEQQQKFKQLQMEQPQGRGGMHQRGRQGGPGGMGRQNRGQSLQGAQQEGAMYNPKTGQSFPAGFKYAPATGEQLQPIQ